MDGERIREEHDPEVSPDLWNVDPPADPAIPLHRFGHRLLKGRDDPLVPDGGPIRPRPSVREVVSDLEDTKPPSDCVTPKCSCGRQKECERSELR